MERRYLVATLALVATFAVFSRGLQSLHNYSQLPGQRVGMKMGSTCPFDSSTVSRWMARARSHLRPSNPEEAQLLAEMNLPFAALQARVSQQAAQQSAAAARCARETAVREAQRAQREAMRMQEKMAHVEPMPPMDPISFELAMPDGLQQRIQVNTSAVVARVAAQTARVQMAADKLQAVQMRIADSGIENIDFAMDAPAVSIPSSSHSPCKTRAAQQFRRAVRDSRSSVVRPAGYAF